MKNHVQRGDVITITAAADITSGQLVKVGDIIGVACHDAASGSACEVAIRGVFRMPKASAAVIGVGEKLVWDISANSGAGEFDDSAATPAAGDLTGNGAIAAESAGNGVTTVAVLFTGIPVTVTAGG